MRHALVAAATLLAALPSPAQTVVEVDLAQPLGAMRDLVGTNKKPVAAAQTPGVNWDGTSLYTAFGLSQVRLHDAGVDLCTTYTAATRLNTGVTPSQPVTGCTLSGTGGRPRFNWTPTSSADADLNNPNNYDFTSVDLAVSAAQATGAAIYLRLGESFNGPNDTSDPVAWAKIATNIYRHVIGVFKPTAGVAVDPVFVEVFNEPDGGFWSGDAATFYTLYRETTQRVRAAAAAAGRSVRIGGAGFTRNVLTQAQQAGNPANGFIAAVGASSLDFYSAHLYGSCSTATLAASASFLRSLRAHVDSQGGSGKPLHITEWNIGLGSQCGEDLYATQRTQSFASGVLTLMQDPAQRVEAAHFYAAMPLMSLFNFTAVNGIVRVNPSAWAFWAHSRLRGSTMLATQVCPQGGSCVAGHAAETAPVLALAGQSGSTQRVVLTNDGAADAAVTLRLKGLGTGPLTATASTPPAGARDLAAVGSPLAADAAALTALLASVAKDTRSSVAVTSGRAELTLTVPARSVQLVEFAPAAPTGTSKAQSDCLFAWAERVAPQIFPPPATASGTLAPYDYRYYAATPIVIATSSADNQLWALGPATGNKLQSLGSVDGYLASAGCAR